jgi:hypothetical protein
MFDDLKHMHISAINQMVERGEMIPTKNIGIELLNLEELKFTVKNGGKVNVAELIKISKFIDDTLNSMSWACRTIMFYHKKSPHYWGKVEKNKDRKEYNVSIDLEPFMENESKSKELYPGYRIPDNYHLAAELLKKFKEDGNDIEGIEDDAYRECANWYMKDKKKAKALVDFIDKNYVMPYLKELIEFYNIKEVKFLEDKMDFVFKKRRTVKK